MPEHVQINIKMCELNRGVAVVVAYFDCFALNSLKTSFLDIASSKCCKNMGVWLIKLLTVLSKTETCIIFGANPRT